jgi:putative spermidine/putrescine transport system ATP-binding protein
VTSTIEKPCPTILSLRNIAKHYGRTVAIDDVSLDIAKGEFVTFLGPSGSGKTTTLLSIAGFVQPSAGHILLDGAPLDPLPPHKRELGMVFQQYALFPHMTVRQNVGYPLKLRGAPRATINDKVDAMLALIGLPKQGDRLPRELSGGQQQRVALARAMVFQPRVLLMDEPLGALDKKLREQMQLEISRLHREVGITILYVTHDQEEALVMSDRIALFNEGRIEQLGPPKELYDRPRTRFVAGFIGESNLFEGKVGRRDGGRVEVDTKEGRFLARSNDAVTEGAAASVAVRPECMKFGPSSDENAVEAVLTDIVYLGEASKYVMRTRGGIEIAVRRPMGDPQQHQAERGDWLTVSWSAGNTILLEA